MDVLQTIATIANIFQIIGVIWAIVFGSKALVEVIRLRRLPSPTTITNFLLSVILLAIISLILVLRSFSASPPQNSHPQATSTVGTSTNSTVTPVVTLTTGVTQSSSTTVTSTSQQNTVPINKPLSCADCTGPFPIKIVLQKVIIDPLQQITTLQFSVTNVSKTDQSGHFSPISFQDMNGNSYSGQGDDVTNTWDVAPGNNKILKPYFAFIPTHGAQYILHTSIFGLNQPDIISLNDETLKF